MRGVPQHVTRSGKRAVVVVVVSDQDFEALQRSASGRGTASLSFVEHLLAIPKVATDELPNDQRLTVYPHDVNFS